MAPAAGGDCGVGAGATAEGAALPGSAWVYPGLGNAKSSRTLARAGNNCLVIEARWKAGGERTWAEYYELIVRRGRPRLPQARKFGPAPSDLAQREELAGPKSRRVAKETSGHSTAFYTAMKTEHPAKTDPAISTPEPLERVTPTASADPVVAEEVGHPVGVGIGALSAGAAGAAIGAVAGPIGVLVGAVVGAVAGGLVGEEVASAGDLAETDNPDSSYTQPDILQPSSLATPSTGYPPNAEPSSGSLFSGTDENVRVPADRTPDLVRHTSARGSRDVFFGRCLQARRLSQYCPTAERKFSRAMERTPRMQ